MRVLFLLVAASATAFGSEAATEKVFSRTAAEPVPVCESGHSGALVNGTLTLAPGETVCISLRAKNDSVVPEAVVQDYDPKNTLVVRFWGEGGAMYLAVYNPLPRVLQYQAAMLWPGSPQYQHTSVCPVLSNRRSIEQWPNSITALSLSQFMLLPDSRSVVCR